MRFIILLSLSGFFSLYSMQEKFKEFLKDVRNNATNPETPYIVDRVGVSRLITPAAYIYLRDYRPKIDIYFVNEILNALPHLSETAQQLKNEHLIGYGANLLTMFKLRRVALANGYFVDEDSDMYRADLQEKDNNYVVQLSNQKNLKKEIDTNLLTLESFRQLMEEGLSKE